MLEIISIGSTKKLIYDLIIFLYIPILNIEMFKMEKKIKKLAKSLRKLFDLEQENFKYVFNKVFRVNFEDSPQKIYNQLNRLYGFKYSDYSSLYSAWKQGDCHRVSTIDLRKEIQNKNEIFPHTFQFSIFTKEREDGILITLTEFFGETKLLMAVRTRPIYLGKYRDLVKDLRKEVNRDFSAPMFVIWKGFDPRIAGDYYSKVYEKVSFIGFKDEALNHYKRMKRWSENSKIGYISYPQPLKEKNLCVGDENIIKPARKHISKQQMWEIQQGY